MGMFDVLEPPAFQQTKMLLKHCLKITSLQPQNLNWSFPILNNIAGWLERQTFLCETLPL